MKMERKMMTVCCVVGLLGLLSAATGFAAEAKRIKGDQVQSPSPSECIYPRSPALALGLAAAASLTIAHVIITAATGCICCRSGLDQLNSGSNLALVCFVVSWFMFIIAVVLLLMGAALNDQRGEEYLSFGSNYCYVVKPGVFAGASVLSLTSIVAGIIYYISLNPTVKSTSDVSVPYPPAQSGIAMGQPSMPGPQNSQAPVFVHEDTYIRRQFT